MPIHPILAVRDAPGITFGVRAPMTVRLVGGLHFIAGNSSPYFSAMIDAHRRDYPEQCQVSGAATDIIPHLFPEYADLAALHLSNIDGTPLHAEANGFYWLAGACGGLGEKYHGGNSNPARSREECLQILAEHVRISTEAATTLADTCAAAANPRAAFSAWVATQRPRWKAEAEACIAAHKLTVYGDPWTPPSAT